MTQLHRLSSAFVKSAPHGKHSDGQGLWLIKRTDGGAQWVLRISLRGKRREMGLGSANDVSLKEARELASEYRKLAKQGIDPINFRLAERRAVENNVTWKMARHLPLLFKEWSLALMMKMTLSRAASSSTSTLMSHYSKAPGN